MLQIVEFESRLPIHHGSQPSSSLLSTGLSDPISEQARDVSEPVRARGVCSGASGRLLGTKWRRERDRLIASALSAAHYPHPVHRRRDARQLQGNHFHALRRRGGDQNQPRQDAELAHRRCVQRDCARHADGCREPRRRLHRAHGRGPLLLLGRRRRRKRARGARRRDGPREPEAAARLEVHRHPGGAEGHDRPPQDLHHRPQRPRDRRRRRLARVRRHPPRRQERLPAGSLLLPRPGPRGRRGHHLPAVPRRARHQRDPRPRPQDDRRRPARPRLRQPRLPGRHLPPGRARVPRRAARAERVLVDARGQEAHQRAPARGEDPGQLQGHGCAGQQVRREHPGQALPQEGGGARCQEGREEQGQDLKDRMTGWSASMAADGQRRVRSNPIYDRLAKEDRILSSHYVFHWLGSLATAQEEKGLAPRCPRRLSRPRLNVPERIVNHKAPRAVRAAARNLRVQRLDHCRAAVGWVRPVEVPFPMEQRDVADHRHPAGVDLHLAAVREQPEHRVADRVEALGDLARGGDEGRVGLVELHQAGDVAGVEGGDEGGVQAAGGRGGGHRDLLTLRCAGDGVSCWPLGLYGWRGRGMGGGRHHQPSQADRL